MPRAQAGVAAAVATTSRTGEAISIRVKKRPDVLVLRLALPGLEDVETTARTISHPAFAGVAVMVIAPPASWSATEASPATVP